MITIFWICLAFFIFGGGTVMLRFGSGVKSMWNRFLTHRENIAKIKALKEMKALPSKEQEIPPELLEAWREVNEL